MHFKVHGRQLLHGLEALNRRRPELRWLHKTQSCGNMCNTATRSDGQPTSKLLLQLGGNRSVRAMSRTEVRQIILSLKQPPSGYDCQFYEFYALSSPSLGMSLPCSALLTAWLES
ncbi:unnamed protein product [Clonostachys solani]|uniref:Uncharacterized protein n=1 Tax=Clonostachys solani TaxID=160281 RepID=A0A9N9Z2I7_9HYPO|nr:unnamed protein product [Clonostachys solani]